MSIAEIVLQAQFASNMAVADPRDRFAFAAAAPMIVSARVETILAARRLRTGTARMHESVPAEDLRIPAEGRIRFVEPGRVMRSGRLIGGVALFASDRRRTSTRLPPAAAAAGAAAGP